MSKDGSCSGVLAWSLEDGSLHVFENRCAHRGVEFCRQNFGNAKEFLCPYPQIL